VFTYSLQGLRLGADAAAPVEVEENETTARSGVYQVLAALFGSGGPAAFERAANGLFAKELRDAARLLPYDLPLPEPPLPTDAAGYEEAYEELSAAGALLGGTTAGGREAELAALRREYDYFGLVAAEDAPLPADHLAVELDFLQYLCFREAAAASGRLVASFRRAERDFLEDHVLTWVPALHAPSGAGPGAFLVWALGVLSRFLGADHAYVASLLGA
jgi:hypothetical protein